MTHPSTHTFHMKALTHTLSLDTTRLKSSWQETSLEIFQVSLIISLLPLMEPLMSLKNTSAPTKTTLRQPSNNAAMISRLDSFTIVKTSKQDLPLLPLRPSHTSPKPERHSPTMLLRSVVWLSQQLLNLSQLIIHPKQTRSPFSTRFMKPRKLSLPLSQTPGLNLTRSSPKLEMLLKAVLALLVLNSRPISPAREPIWTTPSTP